MKSNRLHLVYFHPEKYNGYGACYEDTLDYRLQYQNIDDGNHKVIERGLSAQDASRIERELQTRDGYPRDKVTYLQVLKRGEIGRANMDEQSSKKRAESNRGKKRSKAFRNKMSKLKTGSIIGPVPSKYIPVYAIDCKTQERIKYDSQKQCADTLNLKYWGINHVLKGLQKTHRGYTFEYA